VAACRCTPVWRNARLGRRRAPAVSRQPREEPAMLLMIDNYECSPPRSLVVL